MEFEASAALIWWANTRVNSKTREDVIGAIGLDCIHCCVIQKKKNMGWGKLQGLDCYDCLIGRTGWYLVQLIGN